MKKIALLMMAIMLSSATFAAQKKELGQETMKSIDTVYHDVNTLLR